MDMIKLLGMGANFNRKDFGHDINLFEKKKTKDSKLSIVAEDEIPEEIDILNTKNQQNNTGKNPNSQEETSKNKDTASEFPLSPDDAPFENDSQVDVFRKSNSIRVWGTDVPNPFRTFRMMQNRYSFGKYLEKNMSKNGFTVPTPIQQQAVPISIDGRDLIACAPTGSGKTISFLLPIFHSIENRSFSKDLFGLIISPTRELAIQTHNQIQLLTPKKKISSYMLTKNPISNAMQDPKSRKKFNILIATPLRLVYAIKNQEVDLNSVCHLVLDEADRLLDEGFIEQIDDILTACTNSKLQISLYSATIPSMVEMLANKIMKDPVKVVIGASNAATDTIKQKLIFVGQEEGKLVEIRNMIQSGFKPPCLIFVQSIDRAKELFFELVYDGINVEVMHAEKTKQQRDRIIENFKQGKLWILISTELMARGIDFKGVNLVINYDFPQTVASYIHRIGRTGRAGREGESITYFTKEDAPYLKSIVNVMRQSGCEVPQWMVELKNPSQTLKKNMKKRPIERKSPSTAPLFDKKAKQRKKNIINQSKKKSAPPS
ncbi:ATP-dependent RNA helicase ROK1 [Smittium mucronatum]|uniref:RNA helicase n=1 Tax=Smittium mucronatum TaxID=133383 RepID=A0A1R0GTI1_9FUNG|nr:ATP-dependent RNA helicase ROK1 [Smittium mucronatum]